MKTRPDARHQRGAREWPYRALRALRESVKRLRDSIDSSDAALKALAYGRYEEAEEHIKHTRHVDLLSLLALRDAEHGESDDLRVAIELLAASIDGADVHDEARALIARFEVDE